MKKVIFLDRDGVINKKPAEHDYVKSLSEFIILPTVKEALQLIKEKGFVLIIISNQRGVARGLVTLEMIDKIHKHLQDYLGKNVIHDILLCIHDYEHNCDCRKPAPGLLFQAKEKWDIDLKNSWVIGDSKTDIEAGINAGMNESKLILMPSNGPLVQYVKEILKKEEKLAF